MNTFVCASGTFTCETCGKVILGYRCVYQPAAYLDCLFDHFAITFPTQLRLAVPKRRSEFLAGRFCAQQLLKLLVLEAPPSNVLIGTNREPIWPEGIVGSISHSANVAVCVATSEPDVVGLGVDIEHEIPPDVAADIKGQIVDTEEDALIRSCFQRYNRGLTVVFSAKESIYKATYGNIGQFFDFSAIRLVRMDASQMVFSVAETLSGQFHLGVQIYVNYRIIGAEVLTVTCLTRQAIATNELGNTAASIGIQS